MKALQQGFTIIELIVVIVLLGILSAVALPKFIDVTGEAHQAVVDGTQGGLQSGTALFRAAWTADGEPAETVQVVQFGDGTLCGNSDGYPYEDEAIGACAATFVIDSVARCVSVYSGLLQAGAPSITTAVNFAAITGTSTDNDFTAVVSGSNCQYYYTAETTTATETLQLLTYVSTTGAVNQTTSAALP